MEKYQRMSSLCLLFLSFLALAIVLSLAKVILIPFTMALFISLICSPAVSYLHRKFKLPTQVALSISFVAFIGLCSLIVLLISSSVDNFLQDADQYSTQLEKIYRQSANLGQSVGLDLSNFNIQQQVKKLASAGFIKKIMQGTAELFSNLFLIIVFALFFMAGESVSKRDIPIIEEVKKNVAAYVGTKLITSFLTGFLTYIILKVFSIEMALMFATLTFFFNFIPNIGSLIAILIPIPIIFLQYSLSFQLFFCVGLMLVVQTIIGNILEPKIQGDSMGLHPITVLFCLTFWGFIWGVPGMFLSVPITASLKIIFTKFNTTKPFAELLAGNLDLLKTKRA